MNASPLKATPNDRSRAVWLFLAPYVVLTGLFFVYPLVYAARLAFEQTNGLQSSVFVGIDNFLFILRDRDFYIALRNTTLFAVCSVIIQLPLALGLAMLLNGSRGRLNAFFRLVIFAPFLVGQAFVGLMFSLMFSPQYGLVNRVTDALFHWGLTESWLQNKTLVLPALVIAATWQYVGMHMIYFLAALQNVDKSLVEAARIDGAGRVQVFWHIILPSIKPIALFVVLMSTIGSFQLFELPLILLRSWGPDNAGLTIVGYLYNHAFVSGDLGMGAAVGWVLSLLIFGVSLAQIKLTYRKGAF